MPVEYCHPEQCHDEEICEENVKCDPAATTADNECSDTCVECSKLPPIPRVGRRLLQDASSRAGFEMGFGTVTESPVEEVPLSDSRETMGVAGLAVQDDLMGDMQTGGGGESDCEEACPPKCADEAPCDPDACLKPKTVEICVPKTCIAKHERVRTPL